VYLFGELAIELGFISVGQLKECLDAQAAAPKEPRPLIGVLLVEKGYLTRAQVAAVLARAEQEKGSQPAFETDDTQPFMPN